MSIDDVIADYGVLDENADVLQSVVELAARVADVPMAVINIVGEEKQVQAAVTGVEQRSCHRDDSMCRHVVDSGEQVVVPDATLDPRFCDNPFVTGELGNVRFYASFPISVASGDRLGGLCVFDTRAHDLDDDQVAALADLAARVQDALELARRTRTAERDLRQLETENAELRRSNAHLSAFAGEVSHDLSNPLYTIELSLSVLSRELDSIPGVPVTARTWVSSGEKATQQMRATIEDFLTFARFGGAAARTEVEMGDVVIAAATRLGMQPGGMLRVGELPAVLGNAGQLTAVVHNLLSNALKFSPAAARIEVSALRDGDHWLFEIADRGPGIDPAEATSLFDPLVRGQGEEVEGTGIGLSICRRIVQAHEGSIGLRPRDGGGTVAWFTLPG